MPEAFTNEWVIGLGSNIVVGLIFFMLTYTTVDRRYSAKIAAANNDVLSGLRNIIQEESLTHAIVEAVAMASAHTHGTSRRKLLSAPRYADHLIKGVVESPFIAPKDKLRLFDNLLAIQKAVPTEAGPPQDRPKRRFKP